jgi:hypothetical protein
MWKLENAICGHVSGCSRSLRDCDRGHLLVVFAKGACKKCDSKADKTVTCLYVETDECELRKSQNRLFMMSLPLRSPALTSGF